MPHLPFTHITIIGLGLIGGSLARALKQKYPTLRITGCSHSQATLTRALELQIIDDGNTNPASTVAGSQIVVLCTPLGTYPYIVQDIVHKLDKGTIITEAGSAKQAAIDLILPELSDTQKPFFVPGHPIAGSEQSGIESGNAELYEGKRVILTPLPKTDKKAVKTVSELWQACGATIDIMSAREHDATYAACSHIPQLLAFAYAMLLDHENYTLSTATDAMKRFIRIAGSNVPMWRDIFLYNGAAVTHLATAIRNELTALPKALRSPNAIANDIQASKDKRLGLKLPIPVVSGHDVPPIALTVLLPVILAHYVIKHVDNLDYAGTGLRDFTSPLLHNSDDMTALLQLHHPQLSHHITVFVSILDNLVQAIASGKGDAIDAALAACAKAYERMGKS